MLPQLSSVLLNWTNATMRKVVEQEAVDFESVDINEKIVTFEAMLSPMPRQKVDRKPEGLRDWMWWECTTVALLELDDQIQDEEHRVFKVADRQDWGKAGIYFYQLVEQPVNA